MHVRGWENKDVTIKLYLDRKKEHMLSSGSFIYLACRELPTHNIIAMDNEGKCTVKINAYSDLWDNKDGDGWKYIGRSSVHLTGKAGYKEASDKYLKAAGYDILEKPEQVAQYDVGTIASMAFWKWKNLQNISNGKNTEKEVEIICGLVGGDPAIESRDFKKSKNHTEKRLVFKEYTSKVFKVDECQWEEEEKNVNFQGWHDPVINPQINKYEFSGTVSPKSACFGNTRRSGARFHTGIDLFAIPEVTKVYACLNCKLISYGTCSITLEVINTKELINQMKLVDYKLKYTDHNEYLAGISAANYKGKKSEFILKESDKIYLFYTHLFEMFPKEKIVNTEGIVKSGTAIGYAGVEGNANNTKAPHLHFGVKNITNGKDGKYYLNPALFINLQSYDNKEQDEAKKTAWKDKARK